MHIKNLAPNYSCSAQITIDELKQLHRQGVKSLICFRPDGEHPDQIQFDEVTRHASELNIICYHLPYDTQQITADLLTRFHNVIEDAPKPAHAFCKTGRRAALPVAFSRLKNGEKLDDVVAEFKEHGFDVAVLESHL